METKVTSAIDNYEGIFKFVHSEKAKPSFLRARKLLSESKIAEAIGELGVAKRLCDNDADEKTVSLVIEECQRYVKYRISPNTELTENISWPDIRQRKLERFEEQLDELPQGVFLLKMGTKFHHDQVAILGRKTLSELWLQDLIPEIFCSQIRSDMLLGLLSDWRITDERIVAFFHPFNPIEKGAVFSNVTASISDDASCVDLIYPFPLLTNPSRKEKTSPPDGWDVDPTYDQNLSHGEEHIRQLTVDVLREMNLTSHRLYDPACSTGVFLHSMQKAFPACETIGQDLSQKMCDVAKSRVNKVFCGNALSPKIPAGTADCVFVRFLNSEVVTTKEAGFLLAALLPIVAKGGIMIIFGHTPVLLSADDFRNLDGYHLLRNVGVSKDKSAIFQYYIIQRQT